MHRRLAESTDGLEERARHLALGATGPDEAIAAELERAAEHARARGGHESAVTLAEWARALTPEARRADIERRTVLAAEYRFHSGEPETAREQLEVLLRDAPPGRGRADALRLLGEIRYHQESFPDAIPLFEEALAYVGDDPHTAAGIELRLALCLRSLDQYDQAEVHTRRAVQLSEEAADNGLLAEAVAVMTRLDVVLGRGLDEAKLSRALELEDRNRQVAMQLRPSKIAGDVLLYVGELERSVALLERERERVLERGEENDLPFVLSHLTWAECWRGQLAKAEAHALESIEVASRLGGTSVQSMALTFAAVAAAYRGESDRARQWAEEGLTLAHQAGWHSAVVWGNWALGVLAISLGDAHGAHAALGPLTTVVEGEGLGDPVRTMYLADEIEALISLDDLDRAAHLVDMLESAAERLGRRWALAQARRCRALLLAARGDLEAAGNAAEHALAVAETIEHRLELARTCLVAGQIQRRRRRKAAARQLVSRSVEIFQNAGATIWADRARRELERVSGIHAGPGLTASERRVATLAATGLTNREVAARLFMSGKTVEAHLASTYRKLGIRSRAELGAQLGTPGPSLRD
jgi:DNA-binding CsgD family transcriptional regulator